jgi:hypothetical protein
MTKPVASSLFVLDLKDAAEEVRKIESTLDKAIPRRSRKWPSDFRMAPMSLALNCSNCRSI